ncbi:MAG TPA: hypothetical protein VLG92_03070 [Candidatus Saccharimonadia bacterium]|nr:hypothetical protein [Candidatus Saccharimonadia bacterium]
MSEALQAPLQSNIPHPETPDFAQQPHPAVERIYLLSDNHFNMGVTQADGQTIGIGRQRLHSVEWGTPDTSDLDAMRLVRGYGGKLGPDAITTILRAPEPDDPRQKRRTEDWRAIWTPEGLVAGACDVREEHDIVSGLTKFIPSPAKWQSPSLDALMKGRVTITPFRSAEVDHSRRRISLDGKNFNPNKFPLDPRGRNSEVKYFHRLEGKENSHTWLLLSETSQGLRIDQRMSIPKVKWNEDKAGTGGPLIWLDQYNAICINHGFTEAVNGVGYYYSIGWGWITVDPITGECSMPHLDPQPLVTPDMLGKAAELYNIRRVSYTCGNIETRDPRHKELELIEILVNRGDTETLVVEVDPTPMKTYIQEAQRMTRSSLAAGALSLGSLRIPLLSSIQPAS